MQIFLETFSLPFWLQGLILGERCGHHALDTRKMLRRKDRAQHHYYCKRVAAGWRLLCKMNKYWGIEQYPFVWLAYLDSPWSLPQQKLFFKNSRDPLSIDNMQNASYPHAFKPGQLLKTWTHSQKGIFQTTATSVVVWIHSKYSLLNEH